ncbi:NAD(P)/FAD-dependent oxidoreductase [Rubrivirga sp. IMCC45206]|uniref:NAD(P)/FAD-dependent oxidoreductase n=1 Tax=Rubrivirga sp. IMCC45206 TaxID=3391614 RepID=UPI0039902E9B
MTADAVVVGAGLAGACAALVLSRDREVVVVEAERPAAGASGAAAGLANPFMGRKARPAWRHSQALDALAALTDEAGAPLRRTGIVRPARSPAQAEAFRQQARAFAGLDWLAPTASAERFPLVAAPYGTLWVADGASVDVSAFVRAALATATARGARVVTGRVEGLRKQTAITGHEPISGRHVVVAVGDGYASLHSLAHLPFHRVKGQTVTLARPAGLPPDHPAVAGAGYVVPGLEGVIAGATFEHTFASTAPDPARDAELGARAAALVPSLAGAAVLGRSAGVRLTVPAVVSPRRLPLAGPLPGVDDVWVVGGLGAKGLMTAPLIASLLPGALAGRRPLPPELWPI